MKYTVINRTLFDNYGLSPFYTIEIRDENRVDTIVIKRTYDEGKDLPVGTVLELKVCSPSD